MKYIVLYAVDNIDQEALVTFLYVPLDELRTLADSPLWEVIRENPDITIAMPAKNILAYVDSELDEYTITEDVGDPNHLINNCDIEYHLHYNHKIEIKSRDNMGEYYTDILPISLLSEP